MRHFTASELDIYLDLESVKQKLADMFGLELIVVFFDLGPIPHLLQLDSVLLLPGHFLLLGKFVLVLPVVEYPANWWLGSRRDLNQIKPALVCQLLSFLDRQDADLLSIRSDDAYLS